MTSNLAGDPQDFFKPEFFNRIDEVVRFRSLDQDDLRRIVDIQVGRLAARLADRRLTLDVTAAARDWLAKAGYDPQYGARPLRRVIQRQVEDPLALALLQGHFSEGDTVAVDVGADGESLSLGS
jgi:ATP-dependent Clp protease ATP-binding subunit ClpB